MENNKKILLGKKGEDKYKSWILPPNTWTTIQEMWIENGVIKVWEKDDKKLFYGDITNNLKPFYFSFV